jgi:hypothetical protein
LVGVFRSRGRSTRTGGEIGDRSEHQPTVSMPGGEEKVEGVMIGYHPERGR